MHAKLCWIFSGIVGAENKRKMVGTIVINYKHFMLKYNFCRIINYGVKVIN